MENESLIIKELIREDVLHSIIDEFKIGIFIFSSTGDSLITNKHFQTMFGYSLEELKSKTLYDLFDPQDVHFVKEGMKRKTIRETSNPKYQIRGKRKDNSTIYLQLLYHKKYDHSKIVVKVLDITDQKQQEIQLSKTYKELEDFKYALDQSATVSITDENGDILYVNDKFCEISRYDRKELIGQNHRIVKSGYHPKEIYEQLWSTITKGQIWSGQICNKTKDGTIWWGDCKIIPFLDEHGKPYQYVGIRSDITDRKMMEEKVRKSNEEIRLNERRFRSLVQNSYDITSLLNKEGIIKYVSPNLMDLTGKRENEVIGTCIFDHIHEDDLSKFKKLFKTVLNSPEKPTKIEIRLKGIDGTWLYYEVILTNLLHDEAVNGIAANLRNINESKISDNKIYQMAYYDFLTKLPNRRLFESQLEQEFDQARKTDLKFSLMILDFHGLKFVNDSLGTEMGDRLLQEAALRLNKFVDKQGLVSRIDGTEFAIIFPTIFDQHIHIIAKDILTLFNRPFTINRYELFLTINIGISIYPYSGNNVHSLVRNAYSAFYQSKVKGKNNYQIFSSNMNTDSSKRFFLRNDLRKALQNNEFFLHFQPRIDPKTNIIIGAEALTRWQHPKWGVVSPLEFIPLAEEDGLIGSIGEMVLFNACQQNKMWQEAGLPFIIVSVNFSVIQFLQSDMIQTVDKILKTTGLDPKWLEIEITETALIKDNSTVTTKIERLKAMGINTAIDDFGTGYASLSYLKNLKANTLKIDKSFIDGIPVESDSSEIVASIIQLAKKLNIRTVAEGVETVEQLRLLKDKHCDEIQGYLYSKPVATAEFEFLLKKKICHPNQIN